MSNVEYKERGKAFHLPDKSGSIHAKFSMKLSNDFINALSLATEMHILDEMIDEEIKAHGKYIKRVEDLPMLSYPAGEKTAEGDELFKAAWAQMWQIYTQTKGGQGLLASALNLIKTLDEVSVLIGEQDEVFVRYDNETYKNTRDGEAYIAIARSFFALYAMGDVNAIVDMDGDELEYVFISLDVTRDDKVRVAASNELYLAETLQFLMAHESEALYMLEQAVDRNYTAIVLVDESGTPTSVAYLYDTSTGVGIPAAEIFVRCLFYLALHDYVNRRTEYIDGNAMVYFQISEKGIAANERGRL